MRGSGAEIRRGSIRRSPHTLVQKARRASAEGVIGGLSAEGRAASPTEPAGPGAGPKLRKRSIRTHSCSSAPRASAAPVGASTKRSTRPASASRALGAGYASSAAAPSMRGHSESGASRLTATTQSRNGTRGSEAYAPPKRCSSSRSSDIRNGGARERRCTAPPTRPRAATPPLPDARGPADQLAALLTGGLLGEAPGSSIPVSDASDTQSCARAAAAASTGSECATVCSAPVCGKHRACASPSSRRDVASFGLHEPLCRSPTTLPRRTMAPRTPCRIADATSASPTTLEAVYPSATLPAS